MRILAVILILAAIVAADSGKNSSASKGTAPPVVVASAVVSSAVVSSAATPPTAVSPTAAQNSAAVRVEGEKRFRTNCGRCHMPPHKFPPRMMATIVRHMRVRALITDEDMRYILAYMTQ
jgi:mono/diheme cytochrome c family protein